MFWFIYHLPLEVVAAAIAISFPLWGIAMFLISRSSRKLMKAINILLAVVSVCGIIHITLLRSSSGEREIILMPFHSFIEALEQKEMYRSMLMNVALFVPFGLTFPFVIEGRKPSIKAILVALIMSVLIEAVQYVFGLGRCETDDVICNTLGTAIGSLSYIISEKLIKCKNKKAKT